MTIYEEQMIFSLGVYTVAFIHFILAELIFEAQISFMLEKAVSSLDHHFFIHCFNTAWICFLIVVLSKNRDSLTIRLENTWVYSFYQDICHYTAEVALNLPMQLNLQPCEVLENAFPGNSNRSAFKQFSRKVKLAVT